MSRFARPNPNLPAHPVVRDEWVEDAMTIAPGEEDPAERTWTWHRDCPTKPEGPWLAIIHMPSEFWIAWSDTMREPMARFPTLESAKVAYKLIGSLKC